MAAEDTFGFEALELVQTELVQRLNTRTQQLDQAARANLSQLRDEHRATVARLEATVQQKADEHALELEGRHEMLGWAVEKITDLNKTIHSLKGFICSKMEGEIAELKQQLALPGPGRSSRSRSATPRTSNSFELTNLLYQRCSVRTASRRRSAARARTRRQHASSARAPRRAGFSPAPGGRRARQQRGTNKAVECAPYGVAGSAP